MPATTSFSLAMVSIFSTATTPQAQKPAMTPSRLAAGATIVDRRQRRRHAGRRPGGSMIPLWRRRHRRSTCTPTSPQENPTTCSDFQAGVDYVLLPYHRSRQRVSVGVSAPSLWHIAVGGTNNTIRATGATRRSCRRRRCSPDRSILLKAKGPEIAPGPFDIISRLRDLSSGLRLGDFGGGLVRDNPRCNAWLPPPCRARTSAGLTASASKLRRGPPLTTRH